MGETGFNFNVDLMESSAFQRAVCMQIDLELDDLLEQFSFLGLTLLLLLALFASCQQLTGTIQPLLLPLTHLNRVDGMIASMATRDLNTGLWVPHIKD